MKCYVVISHLGGYATSIQFVTCDEKRASKACGEHTSYEEYDLEDLAAGIDELTKRSTHGAW